MFCHVFVLHLNIRSFDWSLFILLNRLTKLTWFDFFFVLYPIIQTFGTWYRYNYVTNEHVCLRFVSIYIFYSNCQPARLL